MSKLTNCIHSCYLVKNHLSNLQAAPTRPLDINLAGPPSAEHAVVDVFAVSWGLTTVGEGKAPFVDWESQEARSIKRQSEELADDRRKAVTDSWMKCALQACGLITPQASIKQTHSLPQFSTAGSATVVMCFTAACHIHI